MQYYYHYPFKRLLRVLLLMALLMATSAYTTSNTTTRLAACMQTERWPAPGQRSGEGLNTLRLPNQAPPTEERVP
jgi:hypothetical protein